MVLRELVRFGPSIRPHGELLFSFDSEEASFCARQRALQLFHLRNGFRVSGLKGGSEASDGDQADNASNVKRRCTSLDCMDLVKKSLSSFKTGRWQR